MRRFIASLPGKVVSHLVVLALVLPYLTLTLISRAEAQVQTLPPAAVTEFRNLKSPGTNFGQITAQAFADELTKANQFDVQSAETVTRTLQQLGISSPVEGTTNLLRLASAMQVTTIVTGDIVDYEVRDVPGGRQALVSLRAVVYDVASGLPVNGATLTAKSTTRGGDVKDETLIADAISQGALQAVREITSRALPTATVLNTLTDSALINQGTRSGFKAGQEVIINRNREQVGSGVVSSVEPDSSTISITRFTKGIAPGDRVRVLYTPPDIRPGFGPGGTARVAAPRGGGPSSALITTLLLVGLIAVLLSGKNASSQELASLRSEATTDVSTGLAAVKLSWTPDTYFTGGNANRVQWQIWRNDVIGTPVWVVPGTQSSWIDTTTGARTFDWTNFNGVVGGNSCNNQDYNDANVTDVPGITAGVPYLYQINLVYAISQQDLGDGSGTGGGTGGGGNNGGNNGGNGTTTTTGGGTTTGGTTTGGGLRAVTRADTLCYFVSDKTTAQGTATPVNRPVLSSPANGSTPPTSLKFYVNSPFTASLADIQPEYILQFSATPTFTKSGTFTASQWTRLGTGVVGTPENIDTNASSMPAFVRNGDFYWRIGVRNANDRPGPVPDPQTGDRFVFSLPFLFKKSIVPF